MITIRFKGTNQYITPTIFPDGTSQVWKLENIEQYQDKEVTVIWNFEKEEELIWVNQLLELLWFSKSNIDELYIPYLPYARQDKEVTNETTFARRTFFMMLDPNRRAKRVSCLDAHSDNFRVISYRPEYYIKKALEESRADVVVFPDKGARDRYNRLFPGFSNVVVLSKLRDQSTGHITGLGFDFDVSSQEILNSTEHHKILIVDDICDGGATFIAAANLLHENLDCDVALYVTHGIFSKGFNKLIDSGITEYYTTQSLIKNKEGYELKEIL